jgi:hypothetical protein
MSRRVRQQPTVAVGTRVLVPLLWHTMEAEVIEHRGFIGVGGREMVRIQPLDPADDRGAFEMPVEQLQIVSDPREPTSAAAGYPGHVERKSAPPPVLHLPVGARVRVQLPNSTLDMEVVEDRGVVNGQQRVGVRTLDSDLIQAELEVAAGDVEVLSLPKSRRGRAAA